MMSFLWERGRTKQWSEEVGSQSHISNGILADAALSEAVEESGIRED